MFTGIITVAWRGFGLDKGKEFIDLRLGFLSFSFCKGTLWQSLERLDQARIKLLNENNQLRNRLNGTDRK